MEGPPATKGGSWDFLDLPASLFHKLLGGLGYYPLMGPTFFCFSMPCTTTATPTPTTILATPTTTTINYSCYYYYYYHSKYYYSTIVA